MLLGQVTGTLTGSVPLSSQYAAGQERTPSRNTVPGECSGSARNHSQAAQKWGPGARTLGFYCPSQDNREAMVAAAPEQLGGRTGRCFASEEFLPRGRGGAVLPGGAPRNSGPWPLPRWAGTRLEPRNGQMLLIATQLPSRMRFFWQGVFEQFINCHKFNKKTQPPPNWLRSSSRSAVPQRFSQKEKKNITVLFI